MLGKHYGDLILKIASGLAATFLTLVLVGAAVLPAEMAMAAPERGGTAKWVA